MNILDDILNDKNVNNNLKKVMKGDAMSKMSDLAMERDQMFDGTEGMSEEQLEKDMNEQYVEHMGRNILKKVRLELGYSQKQMADALGYTRQDIISGIENGNRTMSGVAVRCLEYLIQIKDLKEYKNNIKSTIDWAEGKWGVGESTDNIIVEEIKKL
tara:strand:+ start:600 stop:1070 length:471 start_codon:yes stop_codon:yes gene_type:complete